MLLLLVIVIGVILQFMATESATTPTIKQPGSWPLARPGSDITGPGSWS